MVQTFMFRSLILGFKNQNKNNVLEVYRNHCFQKFSKLRFFKSLNTKLKVTYNFFKYNCTIAFKPSIMTTTALSKQINMIKHTNT